ncbi:DUF533 domain-containing protein [Methylobacterium komagatae]|uniref:DUF533 domain-containing protein n=1 Tax=Methylobacterium komagatae TaxID=374425 RepID=A0ABW2BPA3_9HYPH
MVEAKQMVDALTRDRQGSAIAVTAVLGGISLIVGLALKALAGSTHASGTEAAAEDAKPATASRTPFDHSEVNEDEARTMLRAMVAATMADGLLDAVERERLYSALTTAKIGEAGREWLDREIAEPADIDQLASGVSGPEQAARIYAAARIAIEPDTLQERQFLKMLADALDVPAEAVARFDEELSL